jgi:hypothetical protein
MTIKDDVRHLVDELDKDAARKPLVLLQDLRPPRVLGEAPIEDVPQAKEERAAITEARETLAHGDAVRDEDLEEERS